MVAFTCLYFIGFNTGNLTIFYIVAIVGAISPTCCHIATQELVPAWFKAVSYATLVVFIQGAGDIGPILIGFLSDTIGLMSTFNYVLLFYVVGGIGFLLASKSYLADFTQSRHLEKIEGIGGNLTSNDVSASG